MNNEMTVLEAKERFFPEYKGAVVGLDRNKPLYICKTIEDAYEAAKDNNRHNSIMAFAIELSEV